MRFLFILLFVSTTTFAQDNALLTYVNAYRTANGVSELKWNSDLHDISMTNNQAMVASDSLMHSGSNTYECAFKGKVLNATQKELSGFKVFIKKYFDVDYSEPQNQCELVDYLLMNIVYEWHLSSNHRKVMLTDDAVIGSTSIYIGEFTYKPNYKMIGGKKVTFGKFISHWEGKYFATLNLNID